MDVESLSIVVPNKSCVNNCKFCVSKMNCEDYSNMMNENLPFYDLYERDYIKRMEFARDNGCNTVMLTGNSEPQQNRTFLQRFGTMNNNLSKPFRKIELQTTGVLLDSAYLRFLRNHVGVNTISLSVSSLDNEQNMKYNGTPERLMVDIQALCSEIKRYDFNLRLSLNMTDFYNDMSAESIFEYCKNVLGADQITFRVLYTSDNSSPQDLWILQHRVNDSKVDEINQYIKDNGRELEKSIYGFTKYSVDEMSTVLDTDCMSSEAKDSLRYMILRENCKLYSKWDDKGSLIF